MIALYVLIFHGQGIKEGWYDGGSIAFAVLLVIIVTGYIFPCYYIHPGLLVSKGNLFSDDKMQILVYHNHFDFPNFVLFN